MLAYSVLFLGSAGVAVALWITRADLRLVAATFAGLSLWSLFCSITRVRSPRPPVILRLGGFSWDLFSFCRGWLIVGETGSGKTLASLNTMLWQVTQNCPKWGGICIDDKGLSAAEAAIEIRVGCFCEGDQGGAGTEAGKGLRLSR